MSTFINICWYSGISSAIISAILTLIWVSTDKGSKTIDGLLSIAVSISLFLLSISSIFLIIVAFVQLLNI